MVLRGANGRRRGQVTVVVVVVQKPEFDEQASARWKRASCGMFRSMGWMPQPRAGREAPPASPQNVLSGLGLQAARSAPPASLEETRQMMPRGYGPFVASALAAALDILGGANLGERGTGRRFEGTTRGPKACLPLLSEDGTLAWCQRRCRGGIAQRATVGPASDLPLQYLFEAASAVRS